MSAVELVVTYRCRTALARAWVALMAFVAPVVGRERAMGWALAGARRLIRVRVVSARPMRQTGSAAGVPPTKERPNGDHD